MLPSLTPAGLLPPGEHAVDWVEVVERFGSSPHRRGILEGIRQAGTSLGRAGCRRLWIDGSFVTSKEYPRDWDGCWDPTGVDLAFVDRVLLDFSPAGRQRMKIKYLADIFPASISEGATGLAFVRFFQVDKVTGNAKGILVLDLIGWKP